jgi:uncharacterized protein (TIGR02145 family)
MKKQPCTLINPLTILGAFIMLAISCNNDDENTPLKVTDIDGNVYHTVTIGTQVWMVENLKVTRFRNGDPIETTSPDTLDISDEDMPIYQWTYEGNESNASIYGRLYTWYTIEDSRGVCPAGWHVPTVEEWNTLTDFLIENGYGAQDDSMNIAKALADVSGWDTDTIASSPGNDPTVNNSSGFTGIPAGKRGNNGTTGFFILLGKEAKWWSSTESQGGGCGRTIVYNEGGVSEIIASKDDGRSIRCLKD